MIVAKEASNAIVDCHSLLYDFSLPICNGLSIVVGIITTFCAIKAIDHSQFCRSVNDGVHAHLVSHDDPSCVAIELLHLH